MPAESKGDALMDNATSSLADASAEWIGPPARLPSAWRRGNLFFVTVSAGQSYTCARTGTVLAYCWETSHIRVLSDSTGPRLAPTEVPQSASSFISLAIGTEHACAITLGGAPPCWGKA
jgi:hypothetical protein